MKFLSPIRAMALALVVAILLTTVACDPKFAAALKLGLAGGPPVFDVMVQAGAIDDSTRNVLISDFSEGSADASQLADSLTACVKDKACKLDAIEKFSEQITSIFARGRTDDPRIQRIFNIVRDIVMAAKVFYGGKPAAASIRTARGSGAQIPASRKEAKRVLNEKLKELKAAMQP